MANYYTGSVSSFEDLHTALVNGCVDNGWSWSDSILSKGLAFVRPYVSTTETANTGMGLLLEVGTGSSGAAITGGSGCIPRLGRANAGLEAVTWPAIYHLFVCSEPDEVFMVLQFNVDRHYWLAFGSSARQQGPWVSASSYGGYYNSSYPKIVITEDAGGSYSYPGNHSGLIFWESGGTNGGNFLYRCQAVYSGIDGDWAGASVGTSVGAISALYGAAPLIQRSPSAWNQESVLVPIHVYQRRPENFWSLVLSVRHARYVRIDNYVPGQVITLGSDQWMVFPAYRKNASVRNGGSYIDHTGTFGWAIRYLPG